MSSLTWEKGIDNSNPIVGFSVVALARALTYSLVYGPRYDQGRFNGIKSLISVIFLGLWSD